MVNAKDTLNEYDKIRSEGRKKLQPLFKEKKIRREALAIAFGDDPKEMKVQSRIMRKKLNSKRKEKNKDLIENYQKLYSQTNENEKQFQILLKDARKRLNSDLNELTFRSLLMGKLETKESKETGEITHEHLLNKPNMTEKDKEGMQKSLTYLEENDMLTEENLKDLDAVVYTKEGVKVGPHTRPREDIKAEPNGKNIYQHGDTTYFQWSKDMIKEQNEILAKQGMEIPLDSHYEESLQALPGNYEKSSGYKGGNILSLITNMSMSGYCDSDGTLNDKVKYGYRWSASSRDDNYARYFTFSGDKGRLGRDSRHSALPVRPVLK